MMNHLRRAAQWAGGVGMSEAPGWAGSGRVASHLTRGPQDRAALQGLGGNFAAGTVSAQGGTLDTAPAIGKRLMRRGRRRMYGIEGARQLTGLGPLTIGGSSGSSGIEPKSSGAVGLPPPRSSGGMQY